MASDAAPTTPAGNALAEALAERREALARLRRFGGERLARNMAAIFLAAVPERLDAARRALTAGEHAALAGAAHALRSSCAQFGASDAARLGSAVEDAAMHGDHARCALLLEPLAAECAAFGAWLEGELAHDPSAATTR